MERTPNRSAGSFVGHAEESELRDTPPGTWGIFIVLIGLQVSTYPIELAERCHAAPPCTSRPIHVWGESQWDVSRSTVGEKTLKGHPAGPSAPRGMVATRNSPGLLRPDALRHHPGLGRAGGAGPSGREGEGVGRIWGLGVGM